MLHHREPRRRIPWRARYGIQVSVQENASLLLTTQSATKVYKTPDNHVEQHLVVKLGPGAVLEYVPDQLIAYRGASYRQYTQRGDVRGFKPVDVRGADPGRSPDGKPFRYDEVRLRTEVSIKGKLAVLDNMMVRPGEDSLDSLLFLQDYTHVGMLLGVDARLDADGSGAAAGDGVPGWPRPGGCRCTWASPQSQVPGWRCARCPTPPRRSTTS